MADPAPICRKIDISDFLQIGFGYGFPCVSVCMCFAGMAFVVGSVGTGVFVHEKWREWQTLL